MNSSNSQRHGAWPSVGPSYPGSSTDQQHRGGMSRGRSSGGHRGNGNTGRGRGRGGRGRSAREYSRPQQQHFPVEDGKSGSLQCGHVPSEASSSSSPIEPCQYRTNSNTSLILHKADRHLIYPPGGKEELDRLDPLLIEERKEQQRRAKKQKTSDSSSYDVEAKVMNTIPGLNIALEGPELVEQWIAERKKRWPSDRVVAKKKAEAWDDSSRGQFRRGGRQQQSQPADTGHKRKRDTDAKRSRSGAQSDSDDESASDSESDSSASDSADSDSGSDAPSEEPIRRHEDEASDADEDEGDAPEEESSKAPPSVVDSRQTEPTPSRPQAARPASNLPAHRRPRPRNPPANPFEPRSLLHALLKNEIHQHVSTVAQLTRFLVRNDFLKNVELQPGQAAEQARRRGMIQQVDEGEGKEQAKTSSPPPELGAVVHNGGLPTVASSTSSSNEQPARSLYRPSSPTLRPLTSLSWPPEPDPLIFMDPLRRDDPKPLTNDQFQALATDEGLRRILRPISSLHPNGESRPGLERALTTLDSLPSDDHRRAALELILGVSAQTPIHPHQIGPTFVTPGLSTSLNGSGRFIGEVELHKLGLRCGPAEQEYIQEIGKRIGGVLGESMAEYEPNPALGWDDSRRAEGLSFREEQRRAYWEREADRRDVLRKLGIDVD